MAIDPVSSLTTAANTSTKNATGSAVSKDEFLKMLVAQLEYQNPLNPQDGAAFVAQLAQFSQLEQSTETNSRLTALQASADAQSRTALMGLVGKSVTAKADQFSMAAQGGSPPNAVINFENAATKCEVTLRDSAGNAVRTIDVGAHAAGQFAINWPPGLQLGPGSYKIEVKATDAKGAPVSQSTSLSGTVDALEFQNGSPRLRMGALVLMPSDVLTVQGDATTTAKK